MKWLLREQREKWQRLLNLIGEGCMAKSMTEMVQESMVTKAKEKKSVATAVIEIFNDPAYDSSKVTVATCDMLARKHDIKPDNLASLIFTMAHKHYRFLSRGKSKGKVQSVPDSRSWIFRKAIEIEHEHTPDDEVAEKIVWDHVTEHGWEYYIALIKMEEMLTNMCKNKKG